MGIVDKWLFPNKGSGRSVNEANDEHDPPGCPYSAKIAPTYLGSLESGGMIITS